jgi:hypothetical protein
MRRTGPASLAVLAVLASTPAPAAAQERGWNLSVEVSTVWFGAGAESPSEGLSAGPGPGTALGITASRNAGAVRIGLRLFRVESGLRLAGGGVSLTADDAGFTLYELAPEVGLRLLRLGTAGAGIRLAGGPTLDLWSWEGADDRTRIGGRALLGLESPITADWTLAAWLEGAVSGSVFDDGDLPPGYERRSLLRGRVGLEVRYGF